MEPLWQDVDQEAPDELVGGERHGAQPRPAVAAVVLVAEGHAAFVEAELTAFDVTGDREHGSRAHIAFDWFLGRNHLDRPLYDFATGTLAALLKGHKNVVNSLAFSPDGYSLAAGCSNGLLKWCWMRNLSKLRILEGHEWPINASVFSPNGCLLATGGHDRTVRLWEANWGREKAVLIGHTDWVRCLAFSPDGSTLASGADDTTIRLWDVASGRQLYVLRGHSSQVLYLALTPDGRRLVTGAERRAWDAAQRLVGRHREHRHDTGEGVDRGQELAIRAVGDRQRG